MEETCVHLDGDQSLVYVAHMVLTFSLLLLDHHMLPSNEFG
jgi:hypothetical protein